MLMLLLALAGAAPNPSALIAPQKAYVTCLKTFEKKSASDKMAPEAYGEAVKTACATEKGAFVTALTTFDVAMGTKRAQANANAQRDVEGYWEDSVAQYKDR